MFKVNLLLSPGMQDAGLDYMIGQPVDHPEEILAGNIATRGTIVARAHPELNSGAISLIGRLAIQAVIVAVILVLSFWSYGNIPAVRFGVDRIFKPSTMTSQPSKPISEVVRVASRFLTQLPPEAEITYFEAGSGVVLYHFGGGVDAETLIKINRAVEGYRRGDAISISTMESGPESIGGMAYNETRRREPWMPNSHAYELFFNELKRAISQNGGEVMRTSAGRLKSGEYILRGDLELLLSHLNSVALEPPKAKYHRVSILKNSVLSDESTYQMRVVFDLL